MSGCPTCESTRCPTTGCNGRPGYVYVPFKGGWFPYWYAKTLEASGVKPHWDDIWAFSKYGIEPEKDRIVILDTETTGLGSEHEMIEVAWCEPGKAISSARVAHSTHTADAFALQINRYEERLLADPEFWVPDHHMLEVILQATLEGATILGSNVGFDMRAVTRWFEKGHYVPPRWHHRPLEIGSYVAGRFGLRRSPSGREVIGVMRHHGYTSVLDPDHTAEGDVRSVESVWLALEPK